MRLILQFTPNLQFAPILQFATLYLNHYYLIYALLLRMHRSCTMCNSSLWDRRSRLMMYSEEDDNRGDAKRRGREIIGISPRVGGSSGFSPRRTVAKRGFSDTRTDQFCLCLSLILQLSHDWSSFTLEITNVTDKTAREDLVWKVRRTICGNSTSLCLCLWQHEFDTRGIRFCLYRIRSKIFSSSACRIFATSPIRHFDSCVF